MTGEHRGLSRRTISAGLLREAAKTSVTFTNDSTMTFGGLGSTGTKIVEVVMLAEN
jgi:hypothetical protein